MTKQRNYGIDLLRILLMFFVCIVHVLEQGGAMAASTSGSANYYSLSLIRVIAICAVDGFAIISGYIAIDKPRSYDKLCNMWFQTFFYSFVITLVVFVLGLYKDIGTIGLIKSAMPVTFSEQYWYFSAYFVLFLFMPILNKYLFSIDKQTATKTFIVLFFIFSVLEIIGFSFNTSNGYSPIWLIVLYCLGVLAKRMSLFENKRTWLLIALFIVVNAASFVLLAFFGIERVVFYISPNVVISAIILVVLFSRIKIKGTIVSRITPYVFGIYLFQVNGFIFWKVLADRFAFVANCSTPLAILIVLGGGLAIFMIGLIVEIIRYHISKRIRIPELSKLIVKLVSKIMGRISIALR